MKRGVGSSQATSILFSYTNESNMPELMQLDNGVVGGTYNTMPVNPTANPNAGTYRAN